MGRKREYQMPVRCNVILEQAEVVEIERRARREGKPFGALVRELMLSVLSPREQEQK